MLKNKDNAYTFFYEVLEPLANFQTYLMLCIARKKYEPTLVKSSQIVLARDIIKTVPVEPLEKLIKMKNAVQEVYFRNDLVPDHAKAFYICTNPTDTFKAYTEFQKKVNQYYHDFIKSPTLDKTPMKSLDRVWFGCLQASATKGRYLIIDLDNPEGFDSVYEELEVPWIKAITRTRGGYHFIVERAPAAKKIFKEITNLPDVEIVRHGITPIPGTIQGGHEVKEIYL
jgi:hypothetical protein